MPIALRKPDPYGITTAQLAGTAGRYASRKPLDVDAAVAELREIANGRGDLLAERAGLTLGFYARENRDEWSRKALQAALLIAAGADLTRLPEWIEEDQSEPRGSAETRGEGRPAGAAEASPRPRGSHRYVASVIVLDRRPVIRIRSVTPRGASWSPSSNGLGPTLVAGLRKVARITPE
jgi:hypothetical protein